MTSNRDDQIAMLAELLNGCSSRERRSHIDMIRPFALTLPQFAVMATLERYQPDMPVSRLSDLTLTPPSSMTHTLDRLVERGLVRRTPHPTDRRAMLISLTASGESMVAGIQAARREHVTTLCAPLTNEELHQLTLLLKKMARASWERELTAEAAAGGT